jgi:hypothetical protein
MELILASLPLVSGISNQNPTTPRVPALFGATSKLICILCDLFHLQLAHQKPTLLML